jgi:hypothetical protein
MLFGIVAHELTPINPWKTVRIQFSPTLDILWITALTHTTAFDFKVHNPPHPVFYHRHPESIPQRNVWIPTHPINHRFEGSYLFCCETGVD